MQEYNTSVHSATGFTPYEVIYGRKARNPTKLADEFPLQTYGSYVCDLVKNLKEPRKGKLDRFYNGKFIIREIRNNNNVVVEAENGKQMLKHKDKVKQCYT